MSISIITATYNAMSYLPDLVGSLSAQSCKDFEWVIVDGGSDDGTVYYLSQVKIQGADIKILSEPDFGIYDALNKGIRFSSFDYYLVIGCDDILYKDAVGLYIEAIDNSKADIITSKISIDGHIYGVRGKGSLINNQFSYVSGHSVGTVFKKKLHEQFGYYSSRYPIAADYRFIKTVVERGALVHQVAFVSGEFRTCGLSSRDVLGSLTENFRIQMEDDKSFLQVFVYVVRLIKNYKRF